MAAERRNPYIEQRPAVPPPDPYRPFVLLLGLCAVLCGAALLFVSIPDVVEEKAEADSLQQVAQPGEVDADAADDSGGGTEATYPVGADAWVRVEGTKVDYPVMVASADDPEYYLWRDPFGNAGKVGTPFVDAVCGGLGSRNTLVYGHRLGTSGKVFSTVSGTWRQAAFEKLGTMYWTTDLGTQQLTPLCAVRVNVDGAALWQRQDFDSEEDFQEWLGELYNASSAKATSSAGALISSAKRAVLLVTCSEVRTNQPWRCITVFVGPELPYEDGSAASTATSASAVPSAPSSSSASKGSGTTTVNGAAATGGVSDTIASNAVSLEDITD